jgi:hypothetical protein
MAGHISAISAGGSKARCKPAHRHDVIHDESVTPDGLETRGGATLGYVAVVISKKRQARSDT